MNSPNLFPLESGVGAVLYWATVGAIVFITALLFMQLHMTRRSLLFGVRIPEGARKTPEAKALIKQYYIISAAAALLTLVAFHFIAGISDRALFAASILIYFPFAFVHTLGYIYLWRKATVLKEEMGWVVPEKLSASLVPNVVKGGSGAKQLDLRPYAIPLALIVLTAIVTALKYGSLPDQIPTHYDFNMVPDQYSDKSFWTAFAMPLISLGILPFIILANFQMVRQKLTVDYARPELSYAQHRLYRRYMTWLFAALTTLTLVFILFVQLPMLGLISAQSAKIMSFVLMGALMLGILIYTILMFKIGQGGSNLNPEILPEDIALAYPGNDSEKTEQVAAYKYSEAELSILKARQDDRHWKLGLFYYNPDDSALLIEDRFGMNSGFNYANPWSWLIAALLAILVLVSIGATLWALL